MNSTSLTLRGVDVLFPFEPYPCQIAYMEKVLEALEKGANALLESPTGTGKTLCLLAASLSWQKKRSAAISATKRQIKYEQTDGTRAKSNKSTSTLPAQHMGSPSGVIVYASRTHSQLSQVISELKSSGYAPKMTVLGSREQLCVHEKISKLRGAALNHACSTSGSQRKCSYKNNLDNYTSSTGVVDIEELASMGKEDKVCPYFLSRQNAPNCEIILVPYNYLIDASIRETLRIDWNDAVVILDEAHNLEKIASDASSFSLSSTDVATCIQEMKNVIKLLQLKDTSIVDKKTDSGVDIGRKPSLEVCAFLLKSLFAIEKMVDGVQLHPSSAGVKLNGGAKCSVLPGQWLVDSFGKIGITSLLGPKLILDLRSCADVLMNDASNMFGSVGAGAVAEPKLLTLAGCLATIFKSSSKGINPNISDYRVFIKEEIYGNKKTGFGGSSAQKRRVLNYWCFSPGVAMMDLKALGVRSLILTSGTLSPMDAFKEDMKVPFEVELENPHVIGNNQIWISALSSGPSGGQLLSTYERRDLTEYKDELGKSILSICQSMLGSSRDPKLDGGVLVFFPSYGTMTSAIDRWKEVGLWASLCRLMGRVIHERQNAEYQKKNVYNRKNQGRSGSGASKYNFSTSSDSIDVGEGQQEETAMAHNVIEEFEDAIREHNKCLLLAVCRGKVSEGIDFKDDRGRVAIVTGIPFSPYMDPWVVLKKQYLDDNCKSKGLFFAPAPSNNQQGKIKSHQNNTREPKAKYEPTSLILSGTMQTIQPNEGAKQRSNNQRLSGQAWYVQSASRAVNQALGRVIRHKKDWGAIFLLDGRFQRPDQQKQLSAWVRVKLMKPNQFSDALASFRSFCTAAINNADLKILTKVISSQVPVRRRVVPSQQRESSHSYKQLVVDSSSIEGLAEQDLNYIDPTLASSKNQISKEKQAFSMSTASNTQDNPRDNNETSTSSNSISKMFNTIKRVQNGEPRSNSSSGMGPSISKSKFAPFVSPTYTSSSQVKLSSKSSSGVFSSRKLTKDDDFTVSKSQASVASKGKDSSSFFNMTTVESAAREAERKRKSEGKAKFKALIAKLHGILSQSSYTKFVNEIKKYAAISKSSGRKIEKPSEIRAFVDAIVKSLFKELSSGLLHESISVLSSLCEEEHVDMFKTTARNVVKELSSSEPKQDQEEQLQRPKEENDAAETKSIPNSQFSQIARVVYPMTQPSTMMKEDSLANGSFASGSSKKRGMKMMTNLQQHVSQPDKKRSSQDIFSALKQINFDKMKSREKGMSHTQEEVVKKARLECVICSAPPTCPLISECGHICCEECWESWLKIQRSCPICRAETHKSCLSRLLIK